MRVRTHTHTTTDLSFVQHSTVLGMSLSLIVNCKWNFNYLTSQICRLFLRTKEANILLTPCYMPNTLLVSIRYRVALLKSSSDSVIEVDLVFILQIRKLRQSFVCKYFENWEAARKMCVLSVCDLLLNLLFYAILTFSPTTF